MQNNMWDYVNSFPATTTWSNSKQHVFKLLPLPSRHKVSHATCDDSCVTSRGRPRGRIKRPAQNIHWSLSIDKEMWHVLPHWGQSATLLIRISTVHFRSTGRVASKRNLRREKKVSETILRDEGNLYRVRVHFFQYGASSQEGYKVQVV